MCMIVPVRCFSCGKLIAKDYEEFVRRVEKREPAGKVLDDLGIKRYCCRRMMISHLELIDDLMQYNV